MLKGRREFGVGGGVLEASSRPMRLQLGNEAGGVDEGGIDQKLTDPSKSGSRGLTHVYKGDPGCRVEGSQ